jgi:hypothetical protein
VLSDPMRRAVYDRKAKEFPVRPADATWAGEDLIAAMHSAEPLTPAQPVSRLEEISLLRSFQTFVPSASEIFDRLWSNFELVTRPKAERLESLTVEVTLAPKQVLGGGRYAFWCRPERFVRLAVAEVVWEHTNAGVVKGMEH